MITRFIPRLSLLRNLGAARLTPILPTTRIALRAQTLSTSTRRTTYLPSGLSRLFSSTPSRRLTTPSSHHHHTASESDALPPNASLSQRLKHLIKSHGWYALGMYFAIGTIDFCLAFALINLLGAEYVSGAVTSVKAAVGEYIGHPSSSPVEHSTERVDHAAADATLANGNGYEGIYAMLLLAYTVHKTLFLPLRVGLTAALTPKLVRWLQARGWAGGAGTRKAAKEMGERVRNKLNSSGKPVRD
jgi:N-terminal acetyltransferase 2